MADDTRNFIEQTQSRSRGYNGRELSADEMATEFAKCDIDARVDALQKIEADYADAEHSVHEAAKIYEVTSALKRTHEILRKVGR